MASTKRKKTTAGIPAPPIPPHMLLHDRHSAAQKRVYKDAIKDAEATQSAEQDAAAKASARPKKPTARPRAAKKVQPAAETTTTGAE